MCLRPSWEPKRVQLGRPRVGRTTYGGGSSRDHGVYGQVKGQGKRKADGEIGSLLPSTPEQPPAWRTGARSCKKSRTRAHVKCAGAEGIGPETRSVPESKRLRQEVHRRRSSHRLCVLRKRELRRTPGAEKSQTPATTPTRDTATSVSRTTWAAWPTWDSSTRLEAYLRWVFKNFDVPPAGAGRPVPRDRPVADKDCDLDVARSLVLSGRKAVKSKLSMMKQADEPCRGGCPERAISRAGSNAHVMKTTCMICGHKTSVPRPKVTPTKATHESATARGAFTRSTASTVTRSSRRPLRECTKWARTWRHRSSHRP